MPPRWRFPAASPPAVTWPAVARWGTVCTSARGTMQRTHNNNRCPLEVYLVPRYTWHAPQMSLERSLKTPLPGGTHDHPRLTGDEASAHSGLI